MSQILALKLAGSLGDVANLLGYKKSAVSYLLYREPSSKKYHSFTIPKRSGGVREISAPTDKLKLLQRRLAGVLNKCYQEIYSDNLDEISHGFIHGRSTVTNAKKHKKKRYVFNVDISDFFGSINFGRVRGFFIADRHFQLDPSVATIIAQIACYKNSLPQGSPCSPIISNFIGHILDIQLVKLSKTHGCTYSRYADDLTFSTNKPNFPPQIATRLGGENTWVPGLDLVRLVAHSGFTLNPVKTRMLYKNSRQEVTGLVVNKRVNVKSEYRRNVRAMVHRLLQKGEFELTGQALNGSLGEVSRVKGRLDQLHGMLGYIDWIDHNNRRSGDASPDANGGLRGSRLVYRKFLFYKEFFVSSSPVLLCEGKTDPIYVTHAIRSLASSHPYLAAIDAEKKIKILLRRFRYAETSTGRILGIESGGTNNLKNFLRNYVNEAKKTKAPSMAHPVIVLVDNDRAGREVFGVAKGIMSSSKQTNPDAEFTHIYRNLYLVATPKVGDSNDSEIEDLFDKSVLNHSIGGKHFDPSNHKSDGSTYGKNLFARKVIAPNADTIDFSGFGPLLDRFSAVIRHHKDHVLTEQVDIH